MTVHPKKILWPTDFSPLSLKAADYACGFRDAFKAELRVLHVVEPQISPTLEFPAPVPASLALESEQARELAIKQLAQFVSEQIEEPQRVKQQVRIGSPWMEICACAKEQQIDLIVMATHGRTGFKHVMMGSVAERVVQHAPCPVLIVKSVERDFTVPPELQRRGG